MLTHSSGGLFWLCLIFCLACRSAGVAADSPPAALVIETVAGNGQPGAFPSQGGRATDVPIEQPFDVEIGPDGALYMTSIGSHRILRLDPANGRVTSVAGNGKKGYAGDGGAATDALVNEPYEVCWDKQRNLYFVEMQNHLVRRVDATSGIISTVAGNPQSGYAGDGGPASAARFMQPHSIAVDEQDNLYVADIGNHRIRRIDARSGTISSIAGNGMRAMPRDGGEAPGNPIFGPRALTIKGNTLWVALREGNSIWRIELDSLKIHHVAGTGRAGYRGDGGPARDAAFNGPKGIAATAEGLVFVVDSENQAIRRIDTRSGRIDTVAGGGPTARGFAGDQGPARAAQFDRPHGICLGPGGSLYVGDTNNHRIRWAHP